MREILFRGKRIDNCEWIYGDYHFYSLQNFIIPRVQHEPIKVIYKTVSQYTGLTDKNGAKIFEGDICKFEYFRKELIGKIVFNEKTASFEIWNNVVVGAYGEKATNTRMLNNIRCTEVIGNIFDNPELLKP